MPTERLARSEFLGVQFDPLSMDAVLRELKRVTPATAYSYVVTPNVDHLVRLDPSNQSRQDTADIRLAYEAACLCICDSRILARLAKLCGVALPVVTGSDLTARLFKHVIGPGDRVMLVGGDANLLADMRDLYPQLHFSQHIPPMGLRDNAAALDDAVEQVVQSNARFIFLAVGSPQQEILAHRIASRPEARGCALCIGAGLGFLAGHQKRAPRFLQKLGLEWCYRLVLSPRRLWRRYLVDGPRIFLIIWKWRRARVASSKTFARGSDLV